MYVPGELDGQPGPSKKLHYKQLETDLWIMQLYFCNALVLNIAFFELEAIIKILLSKKTTAYLDP